MRSALLLCLFAACSPLAASAGAPACFQLADSGLRASRDACVFAHVYDVVRVDAGVRFLDLCSPETPDDACHFSVVSYREDSGSVGNLETLRGQDIAIRGPVQSFAGRYFMILNDDRQLHGGAARFRPDPRLLTGFSAEDASPGNAPELRVNFHHHGRKLTRE